MLKIFIISLFLLYPTISNPQVYFNNGVWMGDICMTFNGMWSKVFPQPIGSFCQIMTPNGIVLQGQIVNM